MELINLYAAEVGRRLPEKTRLDIENELRSLLEDALEDKARAAGRAPDPDLALEVLKEFGPPEKVAASYLPPRYLIGPGLYPTFILVMKIVLAVLGVLGLVQLGLLLSQVPLNPEKFLKTLVNGIAGFGSSLMQAFGQVVFVFFIIQLFTGEGREKSRDWDPRQLKARPAPDQVKPGGLVVELVFTIAFLALLNFHPQGWAAYTTPGGPTFSMPVLSAAFLAWLPWINLLWGAKIILVLVLLRQGRWRPATRWLSAGLNLGSMVLAAAMLLGAPLVDLSGAAPLSPEAAGGFARLEPLLNQVMRGTLGLVFILEGVELAKKLFRLLWVKAGPAAL